MTNENKLDHKYFKLITNEGVVIPQFQERLNQQKNFIEYGVDNNYPSYIIGLSMKSALHSAILRTKANIIGGNGWMKDTLSKEAIAFLGNYNNELHLDQILERVSYDYEQGGAFALNIIWSKNRKSIAEINYIHWSKIRVQPETDTSDEAYFVSDNWSQSYLRKNPPVLYPSFSTENKEEASQILYVKQTQGSGDYYGIPSWLSVVNWIEQDFELSIYYLNSIQNGFHANVVINFPSTPTDEEADEIIRNLRKDFKGAQGERTIFTFSDGAENAPKITPLTLTEDSGNLLALSQQIEAQLLKGHQVTNPTLMGVKTAGELGNNSMELIQSLKIFQTIYADQRQRAISNVFNKLAKINGIQDELHIEKYNLALDMDCVPKDIMMVLQGTISNAQKIAVLQVMGYSREVALQCVPPGTPEPTAPPKIPQVEV